MGSARSPRSAWCYVPGAAACFDVGGAWSATLTDAIDLGVATPQGTVCSFTGVGVAASGDGATFSQVASSPDGTMTCSGVVVSTLDLATTGPGRHRG